jgi:hypothetical protein
MVLEVVQEERAGVQVQVVQRGKLEHTTHWKT